MWIEPSSVALVRNITEQRHIGAVRRDFVSNVGHARNRHNGCGCRLRNGRIRVRAGCCHAGVLSG